MKNTVLKYGLISGLITSVFMISGILSVDFEKADLMWSTILGFSGMIVAFAFIYVAIKHYRDNLNNGIIGFGKAFQIGLYISLIASTMYVVTWMIYYGSGGGQEFIDSYLSLKIEDINASPLDQETKTIQIEDMKNEMKVYDESPTYRTLATYMEIFPIGLVLSLIIAGFMRKSEKKTA